MTSRSEPSPWIALAATTELPIVAEPVIAAAGPNVPVHRIGLPYRSLNATETRHWAGQFEGAAAILLRSGYITAALLERLPDLRIVAVHGAGVDPVDIDACTARGVVVTNTPGANADAVAEITVGLMLALLRRIPDAAWKTVRERQWDAARHTGGELNGRTLGLVGVGQIGRRVARICTAFGMQVQAHDPGVTSRQLREMQAEPVSFATLLATSDILSLHAPANAATRHMIDAAALRTMKNDALLVNCARGSLIDEQALAQALQSGDIGGAALDVLDGEPPDPQSPIYLAPNLILTPHMAGSTDECLRRIATTAGADIARVLRGDPPLHPVNQVAT